MFQLPRGDLLDDAERRGMCDLERLLCGYLCLGRRDANDRPHLQCLRLRDVLDDNQRRNVHALVGELHCWAVPVHGAKRDDEPGVLAVCIRDVLERDRRCRMHGMDRVRCRSVRRYSVSPLRRA